MAIFIAILRDKRFVLGKVMHVGCKTRNLHAVLSRGSSTSVGSRSSQSHELTVTACTDTEATQGLKPSVASQTIHVCRLELMDDVLLASTAGRW